MLAIVGCVDCVEREGEMPCNKTTMDEAVVYLYGWSKVFYDKES
jgi:hypothetical protein